MTPFTLIAIGLAIATWAVIEYYRNGGGPPAPPDVLLA